MRRYAGKRRQRGLWRLWFENPDKRSRKELVGVVCGPEANLCSRQSKRGAWFHRPLRRWYELDGFLLRREQRHEIMIKARTVEDMAISDHNPKILTIRRAKRKKRRVTHEQRNSPIQWNKLQEKETRDRFKEATTSRLNNIEEGLEEMGNNWNVIAEVVIGAVGEICGRKGRTIANPWTVGKEEQLREVHERIRRAVQRRNAAVQIKLESLEGERQLWREREEQLEGR